MSKKKKITSKKKSKTVETGFATLEDLIIGNTTKKVRRKISLYKILFRNSIVNY